jgi:hypothetical protein
MAYTDRFYVMSIRALFFGTMLLGVLVPMESRGLEFNITRISNPAMMNREPHISYSGLAAWTYYEPRTENAAFSHLAVYDVDKKELNDKSLLLFAGATGIDIHDDRIVFVARYLDPRWMSLPESGPLAKLSMTSQQSDGDNMDGIVQFQGGELSDTSEQNRHAVDGTHIWSWRYGSETIEQKPAESLNNVSPTAWGDNTAWQWEQTWPFGYEIMAKKGNELIRITDDRYYDLKPELHESKLVWYGWDGFDYEIYMYDLDTGIKTQLTDNRFDDIGPQIWNGVVVWEGYPGVEADIFMWKDGEITEISDNIEDDLYPRIWDKYVVWQGFDGDDFEIYIYDVEAGGEAVKMTSNNYDDTNPQIHDGIIAWLGYHDNWDSEIYAADILAASSLNNIEQYRLTDNDVDDRDLHGAGRRIIWVTDEGNRSQIMMAEPR